VHHRCTKMSGIGRDAAGGQGPCRIRLPREINAEGRPVIGREALGLISEAEGHWFESSSARHSLQNLRSSGVVPGYAAWALRSWSRVAIAGALLNLLHGFAP